MKIFEVTCGCCGKTLRINAENVVKLSEATKFAYGPQARLDLGALVDTGLDWTADIPDDVFARAVVQAAESNPDIPGHPVTRT